MVFSDLLCQSYLPFASRLLSHAKEFFKINAYIQYYQGKEETSPGYPGPGNHTSSSFELYQRTLFICLLVCDALLGIMQKILNQNVYLWLHLPL